MKNNSFTPPILIGFGIFFMILGLFVDVISSLNEYHKSQSIIQKPTEMQFQSLIEQENDLEANLLLIEKYEKDLEQKNYSDLKALQYRIDIAKYTYNLSLNLYEIDRQRYDWPKEYRFKEFPKIPLD